MARGGVSFKGIDVEQASFKLASGITSADEGKAVAMTAAQTVGLGSAGDSFVGKLIQVEGDGIGTVEFDGFIYVPYASGVVPTIGSKVVVDGSGNVKNDPGQAVDEAGTATVTVVSKGRGIVVDLDTTNLIAVVLL